MPDLKPIRIIGGGLAGLTLGIALRQHGVPVTIFEAGDYPRHRVCGEFISGRGQRVLEQLGLMPLLHNAGAIFIRSARFVAGRNASPARNIEPAIGLSRYKLDALLACEFERLGGELQRNRRASLSNEPGWVQASGRRVHPTVNGWRWFGLKVHARNVNLSAELELHVMKNSYVGVNRIDDGLVNVCGLFRSQSGTGTGAPPQELLRDTPGSALHDRLSTAVFDESSFCSVAGLSLASERAHARNELCLGDALTMIPPATGNGMSMAFESAQIASQSVLAYSRGELSWDQTHRITAARCDKTFARRLRWAALLQRLLFSRIPQSAAGALLLHSERVWNVFFRFTR